MFIIYREFFKKEADPHKKFTIHVVSILMAKAHSCAQQTNKQTSNSPRSISTQRRTVSRSPKPSKHPHPTFSNCESMFVTNPQRKTPPMEAHTRIKSKTGTRGGYVWCALVWKEKKLKGETVKVWNNDVKRNSTVSTF